MFSCRLSCFETKKCVAHEPDGYYFSCPIGIHFKGIVAYFTWVYVLATDKVFVGVKSNSIEDLSIARWVHDYNGFLRFLTSICTGKRIDSQRPLRFGLVDPAIPEFSGHLLLFY